MNYANTEKLKYMKHIIRHTFWFLHLLPVSMLAQTPASVLTLDTVIARIDRNNIFLQSYELKAESYRYSAEASTAWMPPMVGAGTFMTPYPGQKIMDPSDKGNIMLAIEQDIPNTAKLRARKKYIESQGNVERATRSITLNDFKAQAKRLYYNWLIARERIDVLKQNEKIMATMHKIEQVRYPYNQSLLSSVYKASSKIEETRNMIRMQEGTIAKSRAWLNSLMHEPGDNQFDIDTTFEPHFAPSEVYDTASLAQVRKDVSRINEGIRSMQLSIASMNKEKKPDFRIRFDHMFPRSSVMPYAFSVMGMINIPIAPWASKMYKSEIKAIEYNIRGMEKERSGILLEKQGMLYAMQYEIQTMHDRINAMEEKIIPALKKALDANFLRYQENKLDLPAVIDTWEALNMMYMDLLDEKMKHYEMIIDYEKELYR
jgi:outer membrane protein, heavy metal efflux system